MFIVSVIELRRTKKRAISFGHPVYISSSKCSRSLVRLAQLLYVGVCYLYCTSLLSKIYADDDK